MKPRRQGGSGKLRRPMDRTGPNHPDHFALMAFKGGRRNDAGHDDNAPMPRADHPLASSACAVTFDITDANDQVGWHGDVACQFGARQGVSRCTGTDISQLVVVARKGSGTKSSRPQRIEGRCSDANLAALTRDMAGAVNRGSFARLLLVHQQRAKTGPPASQRQHCLCQLQQWCRWYHFIMSVYQVHTGNGTRTRIEKMQVKD